MGFTSIKVRYFGDSSVLLSDVDRGDVSDLLKGEEEWLESSFDDVRPWSPAMTMGNRMVCVRVSGVPLDVWDDKCFK